MKHSVADDDNQAALKMIMRKLMMLQKRVSVVKYSEK